MPRNWIGVCVLVILAGCAQTKMTSFTDPSRKDAPKYLAAMVMGAGMGLEERQIAESEVVKDFAKYGKKAIRSVDVVPPTGTFSTAEQLDRIKNAEVDSVLIIALAGRDEVAQYIPPTYVPGQTTTTVNVIGNTAYATSNTTPGYTIGGGVVKKPRANYTVALYDAKSGQRVWIAEAASRGNAFASFNDLTVSASGEAVEKLFSDGLF